jgi:hypothetical protein
MLVVPPSFKGVTINTKMRLDHELFSSPETSILKWLGYISYHFGLALLGFLLGIGTVEIFFEYKRRHLSNLLPLNRYTQVVSALWYVVTVGGLSSIIWFVGQTGNSALSLPLKILAS